MTDFAQLLQQGAGHAWLFIPSAILLGALHGLEPGHSKTMMAAFIVAVRGTIGQAVLLGLSATLSHTLIVWLIALGGLYLGQSWDSEAIEPYFQVLSAVIMLGVALWMIWRTWSSSRGGHGHSHGHDHSHDETKRIDTGHGRVRLEIFEQGQPPRFRLYRETGSNWRPKEVRVETVRGPSAFVSVSEKTHPLSHRATYKFGANDCAVSILQSIRTKLNSAAIKHVQPELCVNVSSSVILTDEVEAL